MFYRYGTDSYPIVDSIEMKPTVEHECFFEDILAVIKRSG